MSRTSRDRSVTQVLRLGTASYLDVLPGSLPCSAASVSFVAFVVCPRWVLAFGVTRWRLGGGWATVRCLPGGVGGCGAVVVSGFK
jgi:hypothetical protein